MVQKSINSLISSREPATPCIASHSQYPGSPFTEEDYLHPLDSALIALAEESSDGNLSGLSQSHTVSKESQSTHETSFRINFLNTPER